MSFHQVGLHLSTAQAKKLAQSQSIRLKHSSLQGPHTVHVGKQLLARLQKAHTKGSGVTIQLSPTALRHNKRVGAGFFNLVKQGVAKIAPAALGYVGKKAGEAIQNTLGGGGFWDDAKKFAASSAPSALKFAGEQVGNLVKKKYGGAVRRKKRAEVDGGSFLPIGM